MRIVHWILAVCLFTSSCDIILNFNLGGQLRLAQLLMIFICLAGAARVIQDASILWFRGATALASWILVQLFCIPLSGNIPISLQFFALLAFSVAGIFTIVQLYGRSPWIARLMRVYMASFVFVGGFGLLQFAAPLLGLPPLLTTQWIVHGRLSRISAFSYEPSYYATYLLMGWIMLVELRRNGAGIAKGKFWKIATYAVGISLFLSTSKTAWVFMLVELVARLAPPVWRAFRNVLRQIRQGTMLVPLPGSSLLIKISAALIFFIIAARAVSSIVDPMMFLQGTGIGNTAAHSYNDRNNAARVTWQAFKEHPFIGRSLGGVPIYIASRGGITVTSMAQVRNFWGFPVPLDVLVASGIWGFIPFVIFGWSGTFGAFRLASRYWPSERAHWLRALARATLFEWMILMTDQNLLRTYLWFQLAMVATVAYHLEFGPVPALDLHAEPAPIPSLFPAPAPGYAQVLSEGPAV